MNLGVTGTLITLNSTEWTASSKECRDSHGAKGQVLGELGLDPVMKQPEKLKIGGKPRENANEQTNKQTKKQKTSREYFKEEVINPTEYS